MYNEFLSDFFRRISGFLPGGFSNFFTINKCGRAISILCPCCANRKEEGMSLKEKWNRQNNSIRLLLKKLRRHDTVVVAIAVVIAMALCGGLIYLSTPVVSATAREGLEQTENENTEKTMDKLDELQEYLTGLDKTVTESRDSISSFKEKTDKNTIENEKNTEKITNTVTERIADLEGDFDSIRSRIAETETIISDLKTLIERGSSDSERQISEKFTGVYVSLEEIQKEYEKSQNDTKEMISEIKSVMKDGDSRLSKEFAENYTSLLERLNAAETALSEQNSKALLGYMTEINTLNSELMGRISRLSDDMENGLESLGGEMDEKFAGQNAEIAGVKGRLDDQNSRIDGVNGSLGEVQGRLDDQNSRIDGVNGSLGQVQGRLDNQDTSINGMKGSIDSQKESIDDQKASIDGQKKSIDDQKASIDGQKKSIDGLKGLIDMLKGNVETQNSNIENMNKNINDQNTKIGDVNKSINDQNTKIGDVNKSINDQNTKIGDMNKSINDQSAKIGDMNKSINDQNTKIGDVNKSINDQNSSINDMNSNIDKQGKGILDILAGIGKQNKALDDLASGVGKQDGSIGDVNSSLNSISTSINNLGDSISRQSTGINELNISITNRFGSLTLSFQEDLEALKSHVSDEIGGVNTRLEQVFQRVSNGKKLLASALLTKGIEVKEDATFAEIAKGIENIPVTITVEDDIPGEIEYVYHYHSDGAGNECDEEVVDADRMGGCYTAEKIHNHTDECYNEVITYTYWTSETVEYRHWVRDNSNGEPVYKYKCKYCKKEFENLDPGHIEKTTSLEVVAKRKGDIRKKTPTRTLACGMEDGQLLGYEPSCGFVHGQVVAANITFAHGYEDYNTQKGNNNGSANQNSSSAAGMENPDEEMNLLHDEQDEEEPIPDENVEEVQESTEKNESAEAENSLDGNLSLSSDENGVSESGEYH